MAESVKSAERALRIVELLAEAGRLDFPAICARLTLPKSSAHALLATLRTTGFVSFDAESRLYGVGPRAWEVGQAYIADLDVAEAAGPYLQRVRDALGETVQLAVLDGIDNVYLRKLDSGHPLQLVSRVGSRLPAYATGLGKALLAGLTDDEVRRRLAGVELRRFTARTVAGTDQLITELARIRRQGYATDRGEYSEGVFCVAAPIVGPTGTVAAMSVSIPDVRVTPEVRRRTADTLVAEATALSAELSDPSLAQRSARP